MQRALLAGLLLCVHATAIPVFTDPIPIDGSGSFFWGFPSDGGYTFSASGTNGVDTASFFISQSPNFPGPFIVADSLSGSSGSPLQGGATINGITSFHFGFSMGFGAGSLSIFENLSNTLLAQAPLISFIETTSLTDGHFLSGSLLFRNGTFAITPIASAPEPGTWVLVGAGLLWVWRRRR